MRRAKVGALGVDTIAERIPELCPISVCELEGISCLLLRPYEFEGFTSKRGGQ